MSKKRKDKSEIPGMLIFRNNMKGYLSLPDKDLGQLIKAKFLFEETGEEAHFTDNLALQTCFEIEKNNSIDNSTSWYTSKFERGLTGISKVYPSIHETITRNEEHLKAEYVEYCSKVENPPTLFEWYTSEYSSEPKGTERDQKAPKGTKRGLNTIEEDSNRIKEESNNNEYNIELDILESVVYSNPHIEESNKGTFLNEILIPILVYFDESGFDYKPIDDQEGKCIVSELLKKQVQGIDIRFNRDRINRYFRDNETYSVSECIRKTYI